MQNIVGALLYVFFLLFLCKSLLKKKNNKKKFNKIHREIPVLESFSNTVKGLPAVRLTAL